ncbi:hypothetical protein RZS08_47155, partial [Arthrospira platensis SPKY1]|nr:hypothetical protein [Arthrospira platensis SPKY1]
MLESHQLSKALDLAEKSFSLYVLSRPELIIKSRDLHRSLLSQSTLIAEEIGSDASLVNQAEHLVNQRCELLMLLSK